MLFKIAVGCVIIGYDVRSSRLKILLTRRVNEPQKGQWALPGGFVKQTESFEETARAILARETGVGALYLRQLMAYSLTDSSSSNRIASIVYYSLIRFESLEVQNSQQHSEWFPLDEIPSLPFDHGQKVEDTLERVKALVKQEPVIFTLLPPKFPINQVQRFYEELYGTKMDNRNFRKKIQKLGYIEKHPESFYERLTYY